jgi:hypothetical protein
MVSAMSNPSELVHDRDMAPPHSCCYWPHGHGAPKGKAAQTAGSVVGHDEVEPQFAQTYAAQLMGLQPDVIFAASTLNLEALQSGVREGVVRLSRCSLGDAAGREDHFEIERGTAPNLAQ